MSRLEALRGDFAVVQRMLRGMPRAASHAEALSALQAKIGQGKDSARWLDDKGLASAPRFWQGLDIAPGWEDALEAVLRERLNAVELPQLEVARDWQDAHAGAEGKGRPPRVAAYERTGPATGAAIVRMAAAPMARNVTLRITALLTHHCIAFVRGGVRTP